MSEIEKPADAVTALVERVARDVYARNSWWRIAAYDDDGKGRYRDAPGYRFRAIEWEDLETEERDERLQEARSSIDFLTDALAIALSVEKPEVSPHSHISGRGRGLDE